jgi:aryl-alcohol dehydrogenase-like predicted oxidoreductase
VRALAEEKHCTPAQLALAWLLNRRSNVIPIPGTSKVQRLEENVRATDIQLTDAELERIESTMQPGAAAGSRYDPEMMKLLNG